MSSIKVSIIIPIYNAEHYIQGCLLSIQKQSLKDIEIICVDDGSSDSSLDILKKCSIENCKIKIIEEQHHSAGYARNRGIEVAQGEYLAILDVDDIYSCDMLEEMYNRAKKDDLDVVVCESNIFDEKTQKSSSAPFHLRKEFFPLKSAFSYDGFDQKISFFDCFKGWSWDKIFKRNFIKENDIKFQDQSSINDLVFVYSALARADKIGIVDKVLVEKRRRVEGSISSKYAYTKEWDCFYKALIGLKGNLIKFGIYEKMEMDFINYALVFTKWNFQVLRNNFDFFKLKEKMRNDWGEKLGITTRDRSYFYNKDAFDYVHKVLKEKDVVGTSDKNYAAHLAKRQLQKQTNLLVYGVGSHLYDMLDWHPDLGKRIARIFDKDKKKQGTKVAGIGKSVEAPESLKFLPQGTLIAISAIRYLDEITRELHQLNPGLVCEDIDVVYEKLDEILAAPAPVKQPKSQAVKCGLTNLQKQRLRGRDAQARWRQRFLMECAGARRIFWGSMGVRASFLRRKFLPLMHPGDLYIEEDLSRRGQMQDGLPICIPDALKYIKGNIRIIVLSGNYAAVRERLIDYGYVENVDFVEGRKLIAEDENGYIDVPCIDKAEAGMIVYGLGAHLMDMLRWHPELAGRIVRVIDKDPKKVGTIVDKVGVLVEPPEVLRDLPSGTEVAVSAISYLTDITKDIHTLQPGIICRDIDKIWNEYV